MSDLDEEAEEYESDEFSEDESEEEEEPLEISLNIEKDEEEKEMNRKQIREWKNYWEVNGEMEQYLLCGYNGGENVSLLAPFIPALAQMALVKDEPEELSALYNVCYRWTKEKIVVMPEKTCMNYVPGQADRKPASVVKAAGVDDESLECKPAAVEQAGDTTQKPAAVEQADDDGKTAADISGNNKANINTTKEKSAAVEQAVDDGNTVVDKPDINKANINTTTQKPAVVDQAGVDGIAAADNLDNNNANTNSTTQKPAPVEQAGIPGNNKANSNTATTSASNSVDDDTPLSDLVAAAVAAAADKAGVAPENVKAREVRRRSTKSTKEKKGPPKKWPKGVKYVLYLKTDDTWKRWISLRPSNLRAGGTGVFAERQFNRNTPIGFYAGDLIWRSEMEGGSKPSDAFFERKGVKQMPYDLSYRDSGAKFRVVRPKPLNYPGEEMLSLYMGMHYLNNACETFADEEEKLKAAKRNNTMIYDDGHIVTTKKILPNTEIYTGYTFDEHTLHRKEKKNKKGKKGNKGVKRKSPVKKSPVKNFKHVINKNKKAKLSKKKK